MDKGFTEKNPITNIKKGFYEEYKFILPGYNVRSTEINAGIGLVQLSKLNKMLKAREKNLKLFRGYFENDERFIIQKPYGYNSSFCFPMVIRKDSKLSKLKIYNALKKAKIQFRLITGGSFLKHEVKKYFKYSVHENLNNTNYLHNNGFFVGNTGSDLSKELSLLNKTLSRI